MQSSWMSSTPTRGCTGLPLVRVRPTFGPTMVKPCSQAAPKGTTSRWRTMVMLITVWNVVNGWTFDALFHNNICLILRLFYCCVDLFPSNQLIHPNVQSCHTSWIPLKPMPVAMHVCSPSLNWFYLTDWFPKNQITNMDPFPTDLCSHRRSWWFWAESVAEGPNPCFHSIRCKSWSDFKEGKVDRSGQIVHMGIDCSPE